MLAASSALTELCLACRKEAPGCAPGPPAAPGCCRLRAAASMAAPPAGRALHHAVPSWRLARWARRPLQHRPTAGAGPRESAERGGAGRRRGPAGRGERRVLLRDRWMEREAGRAPHEEVGAGDQRSRSEDEIINRWPYLLPSFPSSNLMNKLCEQDSTKRKITGSPEACTTSLHTVGDSNDSDPISMIS